MTTSYNTSLKIKKILCLSKYSGNPRKGRLIRQMLINQKILYIYIFFSSSLNLKRSKSVGLLSTNFNCLLWCSWILFSFSSTLLAVNNILEKVFRPMQVAPCWYCRYGWARKVFRHQLFNVNLQQLSFQLQPYRFKVLVNLQAIPTLDVFTAFKLGCYSILKIHVWSISFLDKCVCMIVQFYFRPL